MALPVLKHGSRGDAVKLWQSLLRSQGSYSGRVDGYFGSQTTSGTRYFQMTHIGPDGEPLEVDGIVGKNTWWAGENASGEPQRNHIKPRTPKGLPEGRKKVLEVAKEEHRKGTKEIPDGSNWGDGVTKILKGLHPAPWCCHFVWWVWKEVFGSYLWGKRHGHCMTAWRVAKSKGCAFPKKKYSPIPGDFFLMLYKNKHGNYTGSGHIGFVLSVSPDGNSFNTIEGNSGNRVKVGKRKLSQSTLVGFINPYGDADQDIKFDKVLLVADDTANSSTR